MAGDFSDSRMVMVCGECDGVKSPPECGCGVDPQGQLPTEPCSESWERDAQLLLAMGAREIDAATVHGLLNEISRLRKLIPRT